MHYILMISLSVSLSRPLSVAVSLRAALVGLYDPSRPMRHITTAIMLAELVVIVTGLSPI